MGKCGKAVDERVGGGTPCRLFEAQRRHLPKPLSTRLGSAVAGSAVPFPPFSLSFLPEGMCRRVGPIGVIASHHQSRQSPSRWQQCPSVLPGVRRAHRAARDSSCWGGRRRAGRDMAELLVSIGDSAGSAGRPARSGGAVAGCVPHSLPFSHGSGIHKPTPLPPSPPCRLRAGPAR